MSGSPRRRHFRQEEDISGQFRVTVPDAGELDQLRTRGGVYRRGLYTLGNRDNVPLNGPGLCPDPPMSPLLSLWIPTMPDVLPRKFTDE